VTNELKTVTNENWLWQTASKQWQTVDRKGLLTTKSPLVGGQINDCA